MSYLKFLLNFIVTVGTKIILAIIEYSEHYSQYIHNLFSIQKYISACTFIVHNKYVKWLFILNFFLLLITGWSFCWYERTDYISWSFTINRAKVIENVSFRDRRDYMWIVYVDLNVKECGITKTYKGSPFVLRSFGNFSSIFYIIKKFKKLLKRSARNCKKKAVKEHNFERYLYPVLHSLKNIL